MYIAWLAREIGITEEISPQHTELFQLRLSFQN